MKKISIVVPVYNEEKNILELHERLTQVIANLSKYAFEIIMIDNGSKDQSPLACKRITQTDNRWKYIRFSRNFGLEASFYAGIHHATGDALIYLFSDLQDPPEVIPDFIKKWEEGFEIVYGRLLKRQDNNPIISALARSAHKLINKLSDVELPTDAGDYRLLSRNVINAIKKLKERNRYMRGISHWVGFKTASVDFARVPRKSGKSSTRLWLYFLYTLNAIISFSAKPIRLASIIGIITMLLSFCGGIFYTVITILTRMDIIHIPPPPRWWASLVLLIFFFGGMQMFFMGILGEYIAQIQNETKRRPLWIIEDVEGIEGVDAPE